MILALGFSALAVGLWLGVRIGRFIAPIDRAGGREW